MKHTQQLALMDDVFKHLETPEAPDGVTHKIDTQRYTSQAQLNKERKKIFQDFPIAVGVVAQLEKNGNYFLHDLTGVPIVVLKGKDGEVRAFINMCRHRGVRLLREEKGHLKKNIVCPYHAWSYDTAGCLKGILHNKGFEGVNETNHSLISLDCSVHFGLVFVVPNPGLKGKFNWDNFLKEVYNVYQTFGLDTHVPYKSETRTVAGNWKLVIDSGLEAYHFKIAHAKTIGSYFVDNAGVNYHNKLHSSIIFPKKSITRIKNTPRESWQLREHANILVNIFPNTVILVQPDHAMVIFNFPIDEKSTLVHSIMLIPQAPTTQQEIDYWNLNRDIFWNAIDEDNELVELQQATFNGFDGKPMTIGSFEKLILQFENLVDKVLEGKLKLTDF
ncbi:SRPBCC family protein [uncultured Microscilla sp.]|uniref:aromatic ring-hydroxylating oxygenase subunit alpha n=1 Tax=uncultured Microscilla sp. TaxID=432653 RepID=UPI002615D680|nr:SRPBCC family protein [uncultured Microscilla sp.]